MRILVVSQCFHPDDFRINDIVATLVEQGHAVRVLTGLPDYASSHVPREYRFFRRRRETYRGAEVVRVPIVARRSGVLFRALNYYSFAFFGSLYARFCRKAYDLVFSYQTSPILQAKPAVTYRNRAGVPLVLYCCDVWPESLKAWQVSEESLLFRHMHKVSRRVYNAADCLPVSSEPFRDYLTEVDGVPPDKLCYLPQHAEDLYADISGRYEDNGCVDFLFAGNIGAVQGVEGIVRAAALVRSEVPFRVHIVGDGSSRAACEQLALQAGLGDRVVFHGKHPLAEMRRFYQLADCFLLTLRGGDLIGKTLPAKFQSYISAGKPVVAAADGAVRQAMKAADCGLCVPAGDDEALAHAMEEVLHQGALFREKGANGRRFYEAHYTKSIFMANLLQIFAHVMEDKDWKGDVDTQ